MPLTRFRTATHFFAMEEFTQLIDVPRLFFNTLWVLGLSIIVAAMSLRQFEAQHEGITFREALQAFSFQFPLWVGLLLVTIGFAGNSDTLWQRVSWIVLAVLNGVQLFFIYQEATHGDKDREETVSGDD